MTSWGDAAFAPRRIALVGASAEAGKAGRLLLDNLLASGLHEIVRASPHAYTTAGEIDDLLAAVRGIATAS